MKREKLLHTLCAIFLLFAGTTSYADPPIHLRAEALRNEEASLPSLPRHCSGFLDGTPNRAPSVLVKKLHYTSNPILQEAALEVWRWERAHRKDFLDEFLPILIQAGRTFRDSGPRDLIAGIANFLTNEKKRSTGSSKAYLYLAMLTTSNLLSLSVNWQQGRDQFGNWVFASTILPMRYAHVIDDSGNLYMGRIHSDQMDRLHLALFHQEELGSSDAIQLKRFKKVEPGRQ